MRTILTSLAFFAAPAAAQSGFPGSPVDVGALLPADFETSDAVWHPRLESLFLVSDSGLVVRMEANGTFLETWPLAGDLEGIALADPESHFVYVGTEVPNRIVEFDFVGGAATRTFDLAPWLAFTPANQGLEALAFVPDPNDPEGGLFHAGVQSDGRVYVFRLPIRSSATSTSVTFLGSYAPVPGRTDLSGLCFDPVSARLYAIYDTANKITALSKSLVFLQEWDLPGTNQEGIAVRGCEVFVAQDQPLQKVLRYAPFPALAACPLLSQDTAQVSLATGGAIHFALRAPSGAPSGSQYVLLGSASGTEPGFDVPPLHVPLNPDSYLDTIAGLANVPPFLSTFGTFGASGAASATIVVPTGLPAAYAGAQLSHAFVALDLAAPALLAASDAVTCTLVP